jgi:hypothetical protein
MGSFACISMRPLLVRGDVRVEKEMKRRTKEDSVWGGAGARRVDRVVKPMISRRFADYSHLRIKSVTKCPWAKFAGILSSAEIMGR